MQSVTKTKTKTKINLKKEEKKEEPKTTILHLKNIPEPEEKKKPKRAVNWGEDVIDNENLNRLKSNSIQPTY